MYFFSQGQTTDTATAVHDIANSVNNNLHIANNGITNNTCSGHHTRRTNTAVLPPLLETSREGDSNQDSVDTSHYGQHIVPNNPTRDTNYPIHDGHYPYYAAHNPPRDANYIPNPSHDTLTHDGPQPPKQVAFNAKNMQIAPGNGHIDRNVCSRTNIKHTLNIDHGRETVNHLAYSNNGIEQNSGAGTYSNGDRAVNSGSGRATDDNGNVQSDRAMRAAVWSHRCEQELIRRQAAVANARLVALLKQLSSNNNSGHFCFLPRGRLTRTS